MWWKGQDKPEEQPQVNSGIGSNELREDLPKKLELVETSNRWWTWKSDSNVKEAASIKTDGGGDGHAANGNEREHGNTDNTTAEPLHTKSSASTNAPEAEPSHQPGRTWGFWGSKSKGELAVAGTGTEENPASAHIQTPLKKARHSNPSTLVPTFEESFEHPALIGRLWARPPYRTGPTKIKRAVVVGVHGYFPARIARTILGEPTGTSLKFASEGAAMLGNWAKANRMDIEIEKIALEGEGMITEREQTLFLLLKNWMEVLRKADFIFFAVHSQGAVVGVHIIARLIEEYKIKAKIGLLAMAGVCLGPMPGMDQKLVMKAISTIENASLSELFQLQNFESTQSQKFRADLSAVLSHGVKTVFVASADDQLVPLYSALCTQVDHPNIFRAVYLDGDTISPQFLAPLLSLGVRRLNSGHRDHGLLTDISNTLAGSLTGSGHSRLYSSDQVYTLALRTILETSHSTHQQPEFHEFALPKQNPYLLPWSVNAILTDVSNVSSLAPTVERLYKEYSTWQPVTKPMKDLKYRLAALKKTKL